jgi:acetyl/propionyl-CoA carboxylase alpha subunit/acetyl-CoA carboxylase carboxyltransferase component
MSSKPDTPKRLFIANRGEIAVRVIRAASELGIQTVAVFSEDDVHCLHTKLADSSHPLSGKGSKAYLDIDQLIKIAISEDCDLLHPGYGFLSENPLLAQACEQTGISFVGPASNVLAMLGDKARAKEWAANQGIPVCNGIDKVTNVDELRAYLESLPKGSKAILKACAGGGGRGIRLVELNDDLHKAIADCRREALVYFSNDQLLAENYIENARHIEIQIIGDGLGNIRHAGERECSIQRKNQKLIEFTPSFFIPETIREKLIAYSVNYASSLKLKGICTVEYLVSFNATSGWNIAFMEVNPRIQVEHPITEAAYGIDLVKIQLGIALNLGFEELGLRENPRELGISAMQLRINAEKIDEMGSLVPSSGRLCIFRPPTHPDLRVDTHCYEGYETGLRFDSLLAKLIVQSSTKSLESLAKQACCYLEQFHIEGVEWNRSDLLRLLNHEKILVDQLHTKIVDEILKPNITYIPKSSPSADLSNCLDDPLIYAPFAGVIRQVFVKQGSKVHKGQVLAVIEAMKMETQIYAPYSAEVAQINCQIDQNIEKHELLFKLLPVGNDSENIEQETTLLEINTPRESCVKLHLRKQQLLDINRKDKIAKRLQQGKLSARQVIEQLVEPDSFREYGALVIAAQRQRRSIKELEELSPGDGLITGIGQIRSSTENEKLITVAIAIYDNSVFAGTQGYMGHRKIERLFSLARDRGYPVILFAEGGGGRPGDIDAYRAIGFDMMPFVSLAQLNGHVPIIGIATGSCFAGNAAFLGCSDLIIATSKSNIGMAGPAMIEGAGLGQFKAGEIGSSDVQTQSGVIDILVDSDIEAIARTKAILSYVFNTEMNWTAHDQHQLQSLIPVAPNQGFDIRQLVSTLCDKKSVMELRSNFGKAIATFIARVEGRSIGIVANDCLFNGGAIDSDAADKFSRFLNLCNFYRLPVLTLCDTPGFMVGPEAEKTATVRHAARILVSAAKLTVPMMTVIIRKSFGLGAQAMAGGSFHRPTATLSWPDATYGAMGLEGAVKLGFKKELDSISDPAIRELRFSELLQEFQAKGSAINVASYFEVDDVIDPAETRGWISKILVNDPHEAPDQKNHCHLDPW